MIKRMMAALAAWGGVALMAAFAAASQGAPGQKGDLMVRLDPCCSTLPVRPGQPPRHYGPRRVELKDSAGGTVVRKEVPMSRWTELTAPVGTYEVVGRGCSSAQARITTSSEPRVKLRCPVP